MASHWNFRLWSGYQLLALLLFTSWWQGAWQGIDEALFHLTNEWLHHPSWAYLVARANQRWVDGAIALTMGLLVLQHARQTHRGERHYLLLLILLMAGSFSLQVALGKLLPVERPSPTLVHEMALRLTTLIPDLHTKDASSGSFPSDHGIGFLTFALFACYRFERRQLVWLLPLLAVLATPRLLSGAHWLSDILCGALPLTLLVAAWLFHTPLLGWCYRALDLLPWPKTQVQ